MSDPEPRRSVRATKGQHKALEQLDQPIEAPKRKGGSKKGKKAAAEPEEPEEEVIRCVCGATEQDADQGEPWIACDECGAWQHNICMGMSQYSDDLPNKYFCEVCKPEAHAETLAGIARGERPWEARRKAYEDEKSSEKKKRGPKKSGRKRGSDQKDQKESTPKPPSQKAAKSSPMPMSEPKKDKEREKEKEKEKDVDKGKEKEAEKEKEKEKEPKVAAGQKRKAVDGPHEKESKKARKVAETQATALPSYTAPEDIPAKITELPAARQGAGLLAKSLGHAISSLEKRGAFTPSDGVSSASRAERYALQIERAVHDTHPNTAIYTSQMRTLIFNMKTNLELSTRLLSGTLTPTMLAVMTTEELASKELQKETAEMKARAEKQAIKITEDGPRIRKTHKGEELINEDLALVSEEVPSAPVPRQTVREQAEPPAKKLKQELGADRGPRLQLGRGRSPAQDLAVDTQPSPSTTDFDINKVFSSVKSPTLPQPRQRPSVVTAPADGPGVDPEVDRLLDDGTQSPPYSPSAESDPDIVWRGTLVMASIASPQVTAKYIGGAKLNESIQLPWDKLIPNTLSVCGRIEEVQAINYLCGLRFHKPVDVVVVNLEPASETFKADFKRIIDYFVSKKRYGVVGDKGVANVRDTYLVPVLPGTRNHPEFMLNLVDNFIPETRTEPMLLAVFVYRNETETINRIHGVADSNQPVKSEEVYAQQQALHTHSTYSQSPATPTLSQSGYPQSGRPSISAPAFSPTSPQGTFSNYPTPRDSQTPLQHPQPAAPSAKEGSVFSTGYRSSPDPTQLAAESVAREILGILITSPTIQFLLPQARNMSRKEWEVIKNIYERDPRARDDLKYLSEIIAKEGDADQLTSGALHSAPAPPAPPVTQVPAAVPRRRPQPKAQAPPLPPAVSAAQSQPPSQPQPHAQAHPQPYAQTHPQPPQQSHYPPAVRNTPIPPPAIPHVAAIASVAALPRQTPPRQTPIPPPPIPPQAATAAGPPA